MTQVVMEGDYTLATKCLEICQALTSQGKTFSFTLTHTGSSFTFTLDTKEKEASMKTMARKKTSPSTQRRNAKRKEEFLKKKSLSPTSVKKYAEAVKKPAEASEKPAEAKEKPAEAKEKPAKAKEKPAEAKENHS